MDLEAATHPSAAQSNCPPCPQEQDKMTLSDHRDRDSEDGRAGTLRDHAWAPDCSQPPTTQAPVITAAASSEPDQPSLSPSPACDMESPPTSPNMSAIQATQRLGGPLGHSKQPAEEGQGLISTSHGRPLSRICRRLGQESRKRSLFNPRNAEPRACLLARVSTA